MLLFFQCIIGGSWAFISPHSQGRPSLKLMESTSFLGGLLKNPFEDAPVVPLQPSFYNTASNNNNNNNNNANTPFDPTPEELITRAKIFLASDMGVLNGGSLIDEDFIWIGATSNGNVLGKTEYLVAARFFELRTAYPDLDQRSHDFRIDALDPLTVRLTARAVGNMRGSLRLRNEVVQPNGRQMVCPPEAISMTFDINTGKVIKLCSGFAMDRLVGNTGGLCGVMAAATVAGSPPNDLEVYPLPTVVGRFFGRPTRPLGEPKSYLAPFPESVMIQLTKGILAAEMASLDPALLGGDFTFCGPTIGPINRNDFVENYAADMFGGAEPDLTHFRVDPYDPYRVWVDVRSSGSFEDGDTFETPPQAMSFTFDDNGFCTRITGDAVMDPTIGNTGGLGGIEGINYAAGDPSPEFMTRPLPQVLGRLQKKLLSPITKIGVDDYVPDESFLEEKSSLSEAAVNKPPPSPMDILGSTFSLPKGAPPPPPPKLTPEEKKLKAVADARAKKKDTADKAKDAAMARKAEAAQKKSELEVVRQAKMEAARQLTEARAEEKKRKTENFLAARSASAVELKANKESALAARAEAVIKKAEQAALFARQTSSGKALQQAGKDAQTKVKAAEQKRKQVEAATAKKATLEAAKKEAAKKKAAQQQAAEKASKRAASQKMTASTESFKQSKQEAAQAQRLTIAEAKKKKAEKTAAAKVAKQEEAIAKREAAAAEKKLKQEDALAQREAGKQAKLADAQEKKVALAEQKKVQREAVKQAKLEEAQEKKKAIAEEKKAKQEAAKFAKLEEAQAKKAAIAEGRKVKQEAAKQAKLEAAQAKKAALAEEKKAKLEETKAQREAEKQAKLEESKAKREGLAEEKKQDASRKRLEIASEKKAKAEEAAAAKKMAQARKKPAPPAKAPPKRAFSKPAQMQLSRTIALPKKKDDDEKLLAGRKAAPSKKTAPRGVPVLNRWRQNRDGSVTGLITGSGQFDENERVTTSSIAKGDISGGNVVQTLSGSKYFLN